MKKAFSLLELLLVIALSGVMALLSLNYLNTATLSKSIIKTELQSHFNLISSAILYCEELSGLMPLQSDGSLASDTLVSELECKSSTPYLLDGGKGSFIPPAPTGMTAYKATQSGSSFYFSTTALLGSRNDEALQELQSSYSAQQYLLSHDATTATLYFYLSR